MDSPYPGLRYEDWIPLPNEASAGFEPRRAWKSKKGRVLPSAMNTPQSIRLLSLDLGGI